ncbi:hypothetical protein [Desulfosporosinus lacus]|uniref:Uncharacterized protein n=1 Tax=Desulfosporosinus lacus DSM 15449 TaxID=1121420 RepID=A0A1M5Y6F7_9FIRM|nr:hypothetical protein [Desulfosporosinus lacus]SHI07671.1 hypothetical protein SAMN02746098_02306 [Desulfosporosinus lacus DSM 15449]
MNRLVLIVFGIAVFFSGITYILGRLLPGIKSVKYSPALLCLLGGLYYLYLAKTVHSGAGFEDLANVVMSMMFLTGFASGLVTSLILDFSPKFKS